MTNPMQFEGASPWLAVMPSLQEDGSPSAIQQTGVVRLVERALFSIHPRAGHPQSCRIATSTQELRLTRERIRGLAEPTDPVKGTP